MFGAAQQTRTGYWNWATTCGAGHNLQIQDAQVAALVDKSAHFGGELGHTDDQPKNVLFGVGVLDVFFVVRLGSADELVSSRPLAIGTGSAADARGQALRPAGNRKLQIQFRFQKFLSTRYTNIT